MCFIYLYECVKKNKQFVSKIDGVATLIPDPHPSHSTIMHTKTEMSVFDWNSLFAQSGKTAVTFKSMMPFKNPSASHWCLKSINSGFARAILPYFKILDVFSPKD